MPALSAVDFRVGATRPSAIYRGSQLLWSDSGVLYPAEMRTLSEPAAGTTLASGGNLATAISGLSSGQTLYLASGGTYTLTATTTMPNTKPGIKIATVPGGTPATITGNFQFRMYGANQELWRVKFNQGYVAGKNVEVSGDGQSIVECDFTNGFNTAAPAANAGAMVLFTTDGPDGVCTNFLMYGCSFHQIGKVNSTFDHALYLKELNGGLFHSNTFYQIHGGYSFHSYPNTKNVEIAYNKHASGLFTTLWEDVPGTETGNFYHHNVWHNSYAGMAHAPVEGNVASGNNNRYRRNAGWNTNTAQGGSSGISVSAGFAVSENVALDPQFGNPSAGDWSIGNQAVADHIATPISADSLDTVLTSHGATHVYDLKETTGTFANSVAGGASPLTANNTVTRSQPSIIPSDNTAGGVLLGSDGYLTAADSAALKATTMSFMAVIKPTAVSATDVNTIFRKEGPQYAMRLEKGGLGGFSNRTSSGLWQATPIPAKVTAGSSYICHMVMDGARGVLSCYINGQLQSQVANTGGDGLAASTSSLYIGGSFGTVEKFTGQLGKLAIFSGKALSTTEIAAQVSASGFPAMPGLIFDSQRSPGRYAGFQYSVANPSFSSITQVADPSPPAGARNVIFVKADERDFGEVGTNGPNGVVRAQAIAGNFIEHGKEYVQYLEFRLPTDLPLGQQGPPNGFWTLGLQDNHSQGAPTGETSGVGFGIGIGLYDTVAGGILEIRAPFSISRSIARPGGLGVWHKLAVLWRQSTSPTQGYIEVWHGVRPSAMVRVYNRTTQRTSENTAATYPKITVYRPRALAVPDGLGAAWNQTNWPTQGVHFGDHKIWDATTVAAVADIDPDV